MLADTDRKTESAYGFTISLRNIYQWRVIDGAGNVVGYRPDDASIARALSNAKFALDGRKFSPRIRPIANDVEWGRYRDASVTLVKFKRVRNKKIKADVAFLLGFLEKKAAAELSAAQSLDSGGKAYEAFAKYEALMGRFPASDAAKKARKAAMKLKHKKAVRRELVAMKHYEIAAKLLVSPKRSDRVKGRATLRQIVRAFKGTQGAARAQAALSAP